MEFGDSAPIGLGCLFQSRFHNRLMPFRLHGRSRVKYEASLGILLLLVSDLRGRHRTRGQEEAKAMNSEPKLIHYINSRGRGRWRLYLPAPPKPKPEQPKPEIEAAPPPAKKRRPRPRRKPLEDLGLWEVFRGPDMP